MAYILGPHTWFNNYPIFSTGKRQSPVDIATELVEFDPNLEGKAVTVSYKPEKHLHIVNTGSSVRADIKEVSGKWHAHLECSFGTSRIVSGDFEKAVSQK